PNLSRLYRPKPSFLILIHTHPTAVLDRMNRMNRIGFASFHAESCKSCSSCLKPLCARPAVAGALLPRDFLWQGRVVKSPVVILCLLIASAMVCRADDAAVAHFNNRVKPLLLSRCVSCHGADKIKGGLRLDSRAAILKSGESGQPAVTPGKPAESLLLQAVMH